jgi:hypothetical protein
MRGAIPPLPQYASMAWWSVKSTGTTLPFYLLPFTTMKYRMNIFRKTVTGKSEEKMVGLQSNEAS